MSISGTMTWNDTVSINEKRTFVITSMTDCLPPVGITINESSADQTIVDEKAILEWWGALSGTNNEIQGYIVDYADTSGDVNNFSPSEFTEYAIIESIQSFYRMEVHTPPLDTSRIYRVRTYGQGGINDFVSEGINAPRLYRPAITKCGVPSNVCLEASVSNNGTVLHLDQGISGDFNGTMYHEIQLASRSNDDSWSKWETIAEEHVASAPDYSYSGESDLYQDMYGRWIIQLNTDGVLTFNEDVIADVF